MMMRKLRNKNRLTVLTVAFAMLFSVGAVFALSDGILDIEGRISVAGPSEFLAWYTANAFFAGADGSAPTITTPPAVGLANQRISWEVEFAEAGVAILTATAINNGLSRFDIEFTEYWWEGGGEAADFGFVVTIDETEFTGILEAGEESMPLTVEVEWFGDAPEDFSAGGPGRFVDAAVGQAPTLVVEFRYAPAP